MFDNQDFMNFYNSYKGDNFEFYESYKQDCIKRGIWNDELELMVKMLKEKKDNNIYHSSHPLFSVNKSLLIQDEWLTEFYIDLKNCRTDDIYFKKIKQRFETIPEEILIMGIDTEKFSMLCDKYQKYDNICVKYEIGNILYNSKLYSEAIPMLMDVIKYACRNPFYYWHNPVVVGCAAWALSTILFMTGYYTYRSRITDVHLRNRLLKLCYLYFTRYISMINGDTMAVEYVSNLFLNKNMFSIDFYVNRARLVKLFESDFVYIFGELCPMGVGINPDIQYMSDYYLAYQTCINTGFHTGVAEIDFLQEALMMYKYGYHKPMKEGMGIRDLEDKTFQECIQLGKIRSISLGMLLLNQFNKYELDISNKELAELSTFLLNINEDDYFGHLDELDKSLNNKKSKSKQSK